MGSQLLSSIPQECFDVHVLRTLKQHVARILTRPEFQQTSNSARESIPEIIYALNMTFQDVEESWRVWRHERVRTVLQSGFVYIRNRITSARWRRNQGRSPAAFQGVYQPFRYVGTAKINPNDQPWGWPSSNSTGSAAQAAVYHLPVTETYGPVPSASSSDVQHVQTTQPYPIANVPGRHGGHAAQAGAQTGYDHHPMHHQNYQSFTLPQAASAGTPEYRPPPGPPPNWQPQRQQQQPTPPHNGAATPVPSSPLLSPEVAAAVEVATRYLEAVNKAVNVCIELNAI
ncbi:hypothetical protein BJV78DRAFT_1229904 [Lactifluus subvellereus]|nr:hypothetical protein BJV78DRAFT_1229904 [Lactifluus subvellereus]